MNIKNIVLAVAMASAMGAGAAYAAPAAVDMGHGVINFEGSVINAACSIDAKSLDQTIQMGAIAVHALDKGGKSHPVDFSIQLHDCDLSLGSNATVAFNGIAGAVADNLDKTFATTDTAGGSVGIVITDIGGNAIEPNASSTPVVLNPNDNELRFQAYVQGSSQSIVPGTFKSVANFVMNYS